MTTEPAPVAAPAMPANATHAGRGAIDETPAPGAALVLGAGGARGLAHIGVLEVMHERGYPVSALVGASMGALVGGMFAAGHLQTYREWACALSRSQVIGLVDLAFGHPGLIKGERVIGARRELVGDHLIEELPIPFTAVATDLASQREVWINSGRLFDAVRASIAIPMLLTPHTLAGRELVDGGLLSPVPIAATRQTFADLVIAVDVNARPVQARRRRPLAGAEAVLPAAEGAGARLRSLLGGLVERRASRRGPGGSASTVGTGLVGQVTRSLDTMQGQLARLQLAMDPPDILVRVPRDACEFYEFWRAEHMIALGRDAASRAFDAWEQG